MTAALSAGNPLGKFTHDLSSSDRGTAADDASESDLEIEESTPPPSRAVLLSRDVVPPLALPASHPPVPGFVLQKKG